MALQHNEHRTNSIAIHADKVSINKRLVWETFMAHNRRLMMATNKFPSNSLICTVFLCYARYRILRLRVGEFSAIVCGVARYCGVAGFVLAQLQRCERFGAAVRQFKLVWTRKENFN